MSTFYGYETRNESSGNYVFLVSIGPNMMTWSPSVSHWESFHHSNDFKLSSDCNWSSHGAPCIQAHASSIPTLWLLCNAMQRLSEIRWDIFKNIHTCNAFLWREIIYRLKNNFSGFYVKLYIRLLSDMCIKYVFISALFP